MSINDVIFCDNSKNQNDCLIDFGLSSLLENKLLAGHLLFNKMLISTQSTLAFCCCLQYDDDRVMCVSLSGSSIHFKNVILFII